MTRLRTAPRCEKSGYLFRDWKCIEHSIDLIFSLTAPGPTAGQTRDSPRVGNLLRLCGERAGISRRRATATPPHPTALEDGALRRRLSHARRLELPLGPRAKRTSSGCLRASPETAEGVARACRRGARLAGKLSKKCPERARISPGWTTRRTRRWAPPDGDGHRRSLFGGDVGSSDAFAIHEPSSLFGALERAEPNGNATDPHSFWDKTLGGGAGAGPSVGTRGGDSAFSASLGEEDRLEMYFEEGKRKAEERRRMVSSAVPHPPHPHQRRPGTLRTHRTLRKQRVQARESGGPRGAQARLRGGAHAEPTVRRVLRRRPPRGAARARSGGVCRFPTSVARARRVGHHQLQRE